MISFFRIKNTHSKTKTHLRPFFGITPFHAPGISIRKDPASVPSIIIIIFNLNVGIVPAGHVATAGEESFRKCSLLHPPMKYTFHP